MGAENIFMLKEKCIVLNLLIKEGEVQCEPLVFAREGLQDDLWQF